MALTTKLVMRQSQSLIMTPQLLQAIKLLQFSNQELTAYIEEELERNPLLERAEESAEPDIPDTASQDSNAEGSGALTEDEFSQGAGAEWGSQPFSSEGDASETSTAFDDGLPVENSSEYPMGEAALGRSATSWSRSAGAMEDGEAVNLESFVAAPVSLKDYLEAQLALAPASATVRMIGQVLIDSIDE